MSILQQYSQNEYVQSAVILIVAIVLAKVVLVVFRKYLSKIAARTRTDLDDTLVATSTRPVYLLMIFIGIYASLKTLTVLSFLDDWIDKVFYSIFVVLAAWLLARILSALIAKWFQVEKHLQRTPQLFNKVITIVIYILAIVMVLEHYNIEITPLVATLGLGGLAVGLALQNTLTNFFAGLHIVSDQPVRVGDYIEMQGIDIKGYVLDIGWRSTRIRTLPNNTVIIPNSKLAESIIINYYMPEQEMAALVEVGVDYTSDLKKVEAITIEVARQVQKSVKGAVPGFEPFIRYHTFADSNINFTVILRVNEFVDKYLVMHEFIKALKERYDHEGIEISWPIRKLYLMNNLQPPPSPPPSSPRQPKAKMTGAGRKRRR
jgi:small-conductance mechanosensitive channel